MSYYLFLDDIRMHDEIIEYTPLPIVCARDYEQFVDCITDLGMPSIVSFDHDLHPDHYWGRYEAAKTGLDCVRFLIDWCKQFELGFPIWQVHSLNEKRKPVMEGIIKNAISRGDIIPEHIVAMKPENEYGRITPYQSRSGRFCVGSSHYMIAGSNAHLHVGGKNVTISPSRVKGEEYLIMMDLGLEDLKTLREVVQRDIDRLETDYAEEERTREAYRAATQNEQVPGPDA